MLSLGRQELESSKERDLGMALMACDGEDRFGRHTGRRPPAEPSAGRQAPRGRGRWRRLFPKPRGESANSRFAFSSQRPDSFEGGPTGPFIHGRLSALLLGGSLALTQTISELPEL